MPILTRKVSWKIQPQGENVTLNRNNKLASTITHVIPLNGCEKELVTGAKIVKGNYWNLGPNTRGLGLNGDGINSVGYVPIDLSAYTKLTLSFWFYKASFHDASSILMETGVAAAGGFLINPDAATNSSFTVTLKDSGLTGYPTRVARPAVNKWHHCTIKMNRTTGLSTCTEIYFDSILQSVVASTPIDITTDYFENSNLYLFSRESTSLFGYGKLQNIVFRGGHLATQDEINQEYKDPWQIYTGYDEKHYVPSYWPVYRTHLVKRSLPNLIQPQGDYELDRNNKFIKAGGEVFLASDILNNRGILTSVRPFRKAVSGGVGFSIQANGDWISSEIETTTPKTITMFGVSQVHSTIPTIFDASVICGFNLIEPNVVHYTTMSITGLSKQFGSSYRIGLNTLGLENDNLMSIQTSAATLTTQELNDPYFFACSVLDRQTVNCVSINLRTKIVYSYTQAMTLSLKSYPQKLSLGSRLPWSAGDFSTRYANTHSANLISGWTPAYFTIDELIELGRNPYQIFKNYTRSSLLISEVLYQASLQSRASTNIGLIVPSPLIIANSQSSIVNNVLDITLPVKSNIENQSFGVRNLTDLTSLFTSINGTSSFNHITSLDISLSVGLNNTADSDGIPSFSLEGMMWNNLGGTNELDPGLLINIDPTANISNASGTNVSTIFTTYLYINKSSDSKLTGNNSISSGLTFSKDSQPLTASSLSISLSLNNSQNNTSWDAINLTGIEMLVMYTSLVNYHNIVPNINVLNNLQATVSNPSIYNLNLHGLNVSGDLSIKAVYVANKNSIIPLILYS